MSRFGDAESALKDVFREFSNVVCDVFRHFSNVFTIQSMQFTEFCLTSGIKEASSESFVQEGHCNTIFIAVTKNEFLQYSEEHTAFEKSCKGLSLRKGSSMMRFQFLEALIRLAEAKFLRNGKAEDIADAVHLLMDTIQSAPIMQKAIGGPDRFREEKLYTEEIDQELRPNLAFLKEVFSKFTGKKSKSRLSFESWQEFLFCLGVFNPFFSLRNCVSIFRNSTLDIADEIRDHRDMTSLRFVDFLEAFVRVAENMIIPSQSQMDDVGVDSIASYYRVMEVTGLWLVIHSKSSLKALFSLKTRLKRVDGAFTQS